jgi:hypothetical protein
VDNTTNIGTIKDVNWLKIAGTEEKEKSVRRLILTKSAKQIIRPFSLAGVPRTGNENCLRHFDRKFKSIHSSVVM